MERASAPPDHGNLFIGESMLSGVLILDTSSALFAMLFSIIRIVSIRRAWQKSSSFLIGYFKRLSYIIGRIACLILVNNPRQTGRYSACGFDTLYGRSPLRRVEHNENDLDLFRLFG